MPRYAHYQLRWSSQTQTYILYIGGSASEAGFSADSLEKIASFSFQCRSGEYYTVRKQTVQRGSEYWYGYRRVQGRIVKRYLGRTADLSIARLEEVARLLGSESTSSPHRSQPNEEMDVSHTMPSSPRSSSGGEQGSEAALPLISSKLSPPRLPDLLVERSHLLARLDSCLSHSLMLLQAPAGFGKTTLVTQWIVQRRTQCSFPVVAWVSLEAFDNDPLRFWRSIIAACQTFQDNIGQTALALLSSRSLPPFEMPPLEMVLTHLLNDISHQMQSALLVLDDYHVIEEPQIHQAMAFFIDHLPTTLRVLLLSRSQPPLPLLRWRARGDLSELHLADLRFSLQETTAFLHQALPVPLSDAVLMRVDTSLEGWAAGLRLLSLTLQGRRTAQEVEHALLSLGDTSGSSHAQQPLLDYFVTEVLQAQPEPLQRFLLQASVLSRLNGILCDVVIGTENTAALLETVERAGLFLEALDGVGRWYRLHSLFTEALRREANRCLGEAVLRALAQRASQWYEDHALYEEAIEAAIQARDMERVALLIEQADMDGPHHELQTLHRWLSQLPEVVLRAHPMLCWLAALTLRFLQAKTAISAAIRERMETLLRMAEEGWRDQGMLSLIGLVPALRAMSAWKSEAFPHAVELAQQALAVLPKDGQEHRIQMLRGVCLFIVGIGYMYRGQFGEARLLLLEAYACSLVDGDRHFTRSMLLLVGVCSYALDELHMAYEYYQQALSDASRQEDCEVTAQALLGLARISFEWNQLEAAEQQTRNALVCYQEQDLSDSVAFQLALLSYARGQITSAGQQLSALLARLQVASTLQSVQMLPDVLVWQARLFLEAGDLQNAERAVETLDLEEHTAARIFQARLLLAQNKPHDAQLWLERLLPVVQEQRRNALEIQVLLALAYAACQHAQQARKWLRQVLSQACSEGFVRIFISEGEPLARLLRQLMPAIQEPELRSYARAILRAFTLPDGEKTALTTSSNDNLFEPLSTQERRVLQLLAAGRTNPEIARELVVSVNTVKGHVKHIYRKLGVNTRLQACEAARHLQIF